MAFMIFVLGIVLCVIAILEILKTPISDAGKAITIILLILTSWLGLAIYYLYAKKHLTEWFK